MAAFTLYTSQTLCSNKNKRQVNARNSFMCGQIILVSKIATSSTTSKMSKITIQYVVKYCRWQ